MMNVLVIGGGGREHAICVSISSSNLLDELYCIPGNPGIEDVATCINGNIMDNDFILNVCKENSIDFVIVGPEAPLTNGVADVLQHENIYVFGPDSKAAELEGSKIFMKDLCKKYGNAGKIFVRENYQWNDNVQMKIREYEKLLN